jgi:hypothetical protein
VLGVQLSSKIREVRGECYWTRFRRCSMLDMLVHESRSPASLRITILVVYTPLCVAYSVVPIFVVVGIIISSEPSGAS